MGLNMKKNIGISLALLYAGQSIFAQHLMYKESFLYAADTLCASAEKLSNAYAESQVIKKTTKKRSRYLTIPKKKGLSSKSAPDIIIPAQTCSQEKLIEEYMNALTLYIGAYQTPRSPAYGLYTRIQIMHIFNQLKHAGMPEGFISEDVILEPGYKDIITQCSDILKDPLISAPILAENNKLRSHAERLILDGTSCEQEADFVCRKLYIHIKILMYMYKEYCNEQHKKIISHAYTDLTWQTLKKMPESLNKRTAIQQLYKEWRKMSGQTYDLQELFNELKNIASLKQKLYTLPESRSNKLFCDQLIVDECKTLTNLLILHRANKHNIFRQYAVTDASRTIIARVQQQLPSHIYHKEFTELSQQSELQNVPLHQIIRYAQITVQSVLKSKKIGPQTFLLLNDILRILLDIYEKQYIKPSELANVVKPLRSILKLAGEQDPSQHTLNAGHFFQLLDKAARIVQEPLVAYTLRYHCNSTADRRSAKQRFLDAAQLIMTHYTVRYAPELIDHVYAQLCGLYASGIAFSDKELLKLYRFAQLLQAPLEHVLEHKAKLAQTRLELAKVSDICIKFLESVKESSL